MPAHLESHDGQTILVAANRAYSASRQRGARNRALAAMAKAIRGSREDILAANAEDVAEAKSAGAASAFLDRLTLDAKPHQGHGRGR